MSDYLSLGNLSLMNVCRNDFSSRVRLPALHSESYTITAGAPLCDRDLCVRQMITDAQTAPQCTVLIYLTNHDHDLELARQRPQI